MIQKKNSQRINKKKNHSKVVRNSVFTEEVNKIVRSANNVKEYNQ